MNRRDLLHSMGAFCLAPILPLSLQEKKEKYILEDRFFYLHDGFMDNDPDFYKPYYFVDNYYSGGYDIAHAPNFKYSLNKEEARIFDSFEEASVMCERMVRDFSSGSREEIIGVQGRDIDSINTYSIGTRANNDMILSRTVRILTI